MALASPSIIGDILIGFNWKQLAFFAAHTQVYPSKSKLDRLDVIVHASKTIRPNYFAGSITPGNSLRAYYKYTCSTCARGVRPRDAYGKGEAYAGFTDQIAGPGPATRTVNAANALVSLPVITSKR